MVVIREPYVLLTGIPRSGTTLISHLVDTLCGAVCLNEPPRYYEWVVRANSGEEFAQWCVADLKGLHAALTRGDSVLDRREPDGSVPLNYFNDDGSRRDLPIVPVTRSGFGADGLLAVKHNELLTAVLPKMCGIDQVRIIAILRHPVPTILSWQSCAIPLSRGYLSRGYRFWPEAYEAQAAGAGILDFQARIYNLYCTRYLQHKDHILVIRYEDVIADPTLLERATKRAFRVRPRLRSHSHKRTQMASPEHLSRLEASISSNFAAVRHFYPDLTTW